MAWAICLTNRIDRVNASTDIMVQDDPLIEVSSSHILLTVAPLLAVAVISWRLDLGLESPILVGTCRTFFQLSLLSFILVPIFQWGVSLWWVVVGYALFMVLLTAFEACNRSKYFFSGMFWWILGTLLINVACVSIFAFRMILQPTPVWDPQYVIPIVGMLLGNCINAISLSLNSILTSMVESSPEIELLQSFGASNYEAIARLLRESIRAGTIPLLNSMAIIGIIAIPGMMTGQILGGSSVTDAARYQILITYLIAACSFGTILTQLFFVQRVCFDSRMILRKDRLQKREQKPNAIELVIGYCQGLLNSLKKSGQTDGWRRSSSLATASVDEAAYLAPLGELTITSNFNRAASKMTVLVGLELTYSFKNSEMVKPVGNDDEGNDDKPSRRIIFQSISFHVESGGTALIDGPSGVGKSTMLRTISGLTALDEGNVQLDGIRMSSFLEMSAWRRQVLYVPQTKVGIPGTPNDFMGKISSFSVWSRLPTPSFTEMKASARELIMEWGMSTTSLDSEWQTLSGGESQRILMALAMSARPKVILLDESTSALDTETKLRVEKTVARFCSQFGLCALWITHDQSQKDRIRML